METVATREFPVSPDHPDDQECRAEPDNRAPLAHPDHREGRGSRDPVGKKEQWVSKERMVAQDFLAPQARRELAGRSENLDPLDLLAKLVVRETAETQDSRV